MEKMDTGVSRGNFMVLILTGTILPDKLEPQKVCSYLMVFRLVTFVKIPINYGVRINLVICTSQLF